MSRVAVRWRLTAAFAAVMAAVLTAVGVFVYQRQATNLDHAINHALRARAADVAALAQQSDTGLADARTLGRVSNTGLAELIAASGRVLDRTPGLPPRPLLGPRVIEAARRGATVTVERRVLGNQPVRLLAERVHAQDQTLVIIVGQSLQERNLALSDLGGVLIVGGPVTLLLASLAGYLLTGAALRPVEEMRRRAASISAADLDQRLPAAGGNDELGRLGRTLNEMLTRIRRSLERERTLVSDASHELRTPLTVLRAELELIGREQPAGPELQSAVGSAIEETDRLTQLADDLLLLARADHRQLAIAASGLSAAELLQQAAERARRHPDAAGKQICVDGAVGLRVLADHDRVGQALDNLLTNAMRHGNGHVELTARHNGEFVELHVLDDGPGFPPISSPTPGSALREPTPDAVKTERGSDSRSSARSLKRTGARPAPGTPRRVAPTSGSRYRRQR